MARPRPAVGALTKLTFLALIPGVVVALGAARLAIARGPNAPGARRGGAPLLGLLAAALVLFGALNAGVWDRPRGAAA